MIRKFGNVYRDYFEKNPGIREKIFLTGKVFSTDPAVMQETFYNNRMQRIESMEDAMQTCHEKGIGILAIKSMGFSVQKKTALQKLPIKERLDRLLRSNNVSFEQLKLKRIWKNPFLTSICSLMPNSSILQSNVLAAIDEKPLNPEIEKLLADYVSATDKFFCRRCGLCETPNAASTTHKGSIYGIYPKYMTLHSAG